MSLSLFIQSARPLLEEGMQRALQEYAPEQDTQLYQMLAYHMGWWGDGAGAAAQGKRIRPILLLLCCAASGDDWKKALPAAYAVEFLHNFSLIHDDIQDNSHFRRGRETVWKRWGIAQAINAGDFLFTLSHLCMVKLSELSPEMAAQAMHLFDSAAIRLTRGQYLDLLYEAQGDVSLEDYWLMVGGKTAELLACCCETGALIAGALHDVRQNFQKFGYTLGLAFQVQDDWLGIWGDETVTGKSAESDLMTGKKTLPVLFALNRGGRFAERWRRGGIMPSEVPHLADLLAEEGAKEYTERKAAEMIKESVDYLELAAKDVQAKNALLEMLHLLTGRSS